MQTRYKVDHLENRKYWVFSTENARKRVFISFYIILGETKNRDFLDIQALVALSDRPPTQNTENPKDTSFTEISITVFRLFQRC